MGSVSFGWPSSCSSTLTVCANLDAKRSPKTQGNGRFGAGAQIPETETISSDEITQALDAADSNGSSGVSGRDEEAPKPMLPRQTTLRHQNSFNERVGSALAIEVDSVSEHEPKESGSRSARRTTHICTIEPVTCSFEQLESLAMGGMNVASLNMCHGTQEWHRQVIRHVRRLNSEKGFIVAIIMDTPGSEIHMDDLGGADVAKAEIGEVWVFSVRSINSSLPERTAVVNYEGFAEDVMVGDELNVDGGMMRFEIVKKFGPDGHCTCFDPGLMLPRANLAFWRDGHVVREQGVDFISVTFVKDADVIKHPKSYILARLPNRLVGIFANIESRDSLKNLEDIIKASDGTMIAHGDLGADIPMEQVSSVHQQIVKLCRQLNKPVIVASQLLESMIEFPTPTRAEVQYK